LMVRLVLLAYASGPRSIVRADGFPTRTIMHIITMTKQYTFGRPEAAPAIAGDGAPEITEGMLAAGERELVEEIGICGADIARGIAEAVYRAMWAAKAR
jgi:hypothetical protein